MASTRGADRRGAIFHDGAPFPIEKPTLFFFDRHSWQHTMGPYNPRAAMGPGRRLGLFFTDATVIENVRTIRDTPPYKTTT